MEVSPQRTQKLLDRLDGLNPPRAHCGDKKENYPQSNMRCNALQWIIAKSIAMIIPAILVRNIRSTYSIRRIHPLPRHYLWELIKKEENLRSVKKFRQIVIFGVIKWVKIFTNAFGQADF